MLQYHTTYYNIHGAALADALAAELDKAQADIAALREQLAASIAKQEQQQAIINQETAAAIENKHRVELAEVARAELKTRADQFSELLKEEQAAHKATRTALETSQAEKSRLDGMLSVYEAIGGSSKQPEAEPSKKPPRKPKQAKEQPKNCP